MEKRLVWLSLICSGVMAFGLGACSTGGVESSSPSSSTGGEGHEHTFGAWAYTETHHVRECDCGQKEELVHTCDEKGICTACGVITVGTEGLEFFVDRNFGWESGKTYYSVRLGTATETDIVVPTFYNGELVVTVNAYAFAYESALTSIILPDSIEYVSECAFEGSDGLIQTKDGVSYVDKWVVRGDNALTVVELPEGTRGIIGYAFSGCTALTSVTMPDSVVSIGYGAFTRCTALKAVRFSEGLKRIDVVAFQYCSELECLEFPDNITEIGTHAFFECTKLKSVTLPKNLTKLGGGWGGAFIGCTSLESVVIPDKVELLLGEFYRCSSLKSVTIPDGVKGIESAFQECDALESIAVSTGNTAYQSIDGVLYTKDGTTLVRYPSAKAGTEFTVPEGVLYIEKSAFSNAKNLTSVIIADSVLSVGSYAFSDCAALAEIEIADSVLSVGMDAFSGCVALVETDNGVSYVDGWAIAGEESLTSLSLRADTRGIAVEAFNECTNLTGNLVFPDGLVAVGEYAFRCCNGLTGVTIPASVKQVGAWAFYDCKGLTGVYVNDIAAWCAIDFEVEMSAGTNPLEYAKNLYFNGSLVETLRIPDGVTSINDYAFAYCESITSVILPQGLRYIGKYAFAACTNLAGDLVIPDEVTEIGEFAFRETKITSLVIPDGVTTLGDRSFYMCFKLKTVFIGKGVTSMGVNVFNECGLNDITVDEENTAYQSIDGSLYTKDGKTLLLYVPKEWGVFVVLPDGVTAIGDQAFTNMNEITGISFPQGLTYIGKAAFFGCLSLTGDLVIPEGVTSIEESAFKYTSITSVLIPNSVTFIGDDAFFGCENLETISISKGLTSIEVGAFGWCNNVKNIIVDEENTAYQSIDGSLYSKDGKTLVRYAADEGEGVFVVPDGVTTIDEYAFPLSKAGTLVLPKSVTDIKDYAFGSWGPEFVAVFYCGTESDWAAVEIDTYYNDNLLNSPIAYYSETEPTQSGYYWHYVDGVPTAW